MFINGHSLSWHNAAYFSGDGVNKWADLVQAVCAVGRATSVTSRVIIRYKMDDQLYARWPSRTIARLTINV